MWCMYGRHTDNQVTTKFSRLDGLPNSLRYGAPLVRLGRAGAPLKNVKECEG